MEFMKNHFHHVCIILMLHLAQVHAIFNVTIMHTNDVHARFEQFNSYGSACSEDDAGEGNCYGGVARRVTKVNEIRQSAENSLLLDGGDQFQGTTWFYFYRGDATAYFMNLIGYDAMALGNHEFDNGVQGLVPFLENVSFPVLSSNIDATKEPSIDGLFSKSTVLVIDGEQIGVVGYTYSRTYEISSPGDLEFSDEIVAIQAEVDKLEGQGVNKIIAVGHSGFDVDLKIAAKVRGVDVVVGGHTDTFLYSGTPPSTEIPLGPYPYIVTQESTGNKVPVVQDYTFGKYLGFLEVTFDDTGKVINCGGNPILLDSSVEEDPDALQEINKWAEPVVNSSKVVVGNTNVFLEGDRNQCRSRECNLGNLISDAVVRSMVNYQGEDGWSDVSIAIINGGGIRTSIPQGEITNGVVTTVLPFGNTFDIVEIEGRHLLSALENSVAEYDVVTLPGRFLQFSGLSVSYDLSGTPGSRVVSARARCSACSVPVLEPIDPDMTYKVALTSFLAGGGDGYTMISENIITMITGKLDSAVLAEYIQDYSPIIHGIDERIFFVKEETENGSGRLVSSSILFVVLHQMSRRLFL